MAGAGALRPNFECGEREERVWDDGYCGCVSCLDFAKPQVVISRLGQHPMAELCLALLLFLLSKICQVAVITATPKSTRSLRRQLFLSCFILWFLPAAKGAADHSAFAVSCGGNAGKCNVA
eukprot:6202117-Pleurochrysis_carterae.AAC.2